MVNKTWYIRDAQGNTLAVYSKKDSDPLLWNEQHLYGSTRLGMWRPDTTVAANPPVVQGGTPIQDSLMLGSRSYELTNHLGNVLSVISDKKVGNDSSGVVNYYIAEVLSQNDYYPFGMMQPGRSWSAGNQYRYGFNGKENDNEVKGEGNQQDYGLRYFDPRLGRFLSIDPLSKSYPWYTPYQFAGNSPVKFIDLDGAEPAVSENPNLWGKESRMWLVNKAYRMTGGDRNYNDGPLPILSNGDFVKEVDKTKFFGNNTKDKKNRFVNETSQFLVKDNNNFSERDLVNNLLGDFIWGTGPENVVFEHNGKWSKVLISSIAVGETLAKWNKDGQEDGIYSWNMGLRGEINVDVNSGLVSLEHFLGSVSTRITRINQNEIKLEIFNVTSLTSGDINKDVPIIGPDGLKSWPRNPNSSGYQIDHTNTSQYFSFTLTKEEYEKKVAQFDSSSNQKDKK